MSSNDPYGYDYEYLRRVMRDEDWSYNNTWKTDPLSLDEKQLAVLAKKLTSQMRPSGGKINTAPTKSAPPPPPPKPKCHGKVQQVSSDEFDCLPAEFKLALFKNRVKVDYEPDEEMESWLNTTCSGIFVIDENDGTIWGGDGFLIMFEDETDMAQFVLKYTG